MELKLSKKITKPDFQGEFTASILAAAASPDIISFAGGLPNPVSFPVEEMDAAVHKVMQEKGAVALQYSNTQGYQRYHHHQRLPAGAGDGRRRADRSGRQGSR